MLHFLKVNLPPTGLLDFEFADSGVVLRMRKLLRNVSANPVLFSLSSSFRPPPEECVRERAD